MAVRSLKTGLYSRSLLVGNTATSNSYESIATQTVGAGGAASVTFSSIPQTYTHLEIRGISRTASTGTYAIFRPNGDANTANYTLHMMYGNGSAVTPYTSASGVFDGAYVWYGSASSGMANYFGPGVVTILDYKNTSKYKTLDCISGTDNNGASVGYVFRASSAWLNTAAITSLTIVGQSGNLAEYSTFALYGIKSA